ncbi:hypothetical protein [Halalkalibacter urbisdiaboli]|uniref:hypothetical protein n=1 Tax=Halalkalibacter urbisdiaboli TaxID=1960589 RepID=UPI001A982A32|nr:hypothetical protein [Halalkalibacter urbisdiaboli]
MKMRIDAVGLIPEKWEFGFPVKQSNEVSVVRPQEMKIIEGAEVEISKKYPIQYILDWVLQDRTFL